MEALYTTSNSNNSFNSILVILEKEDLQHEELDGKLINVSVWSNPLLLLIVPSDINTEK